MELRSLNHGNPSPGQVIIAQDFDLDRHSLASRLPNKRVCREVRRATVWLEPVGRLTIGHPPDHHTPHQQPHQHPCAHPARVHGPSVAKEPAHKSQLACGRCHPGHTVLVLRYSEDSWNTPAGTRQGAGLLEAGER